jgi:hypothetical protein
MLLSILGPYRASIVTSIGPFSNGYFCALSGLPDELGKTCEILFHLGLGASMCGTFICLVPCLS